MTNPTATQPHGDQHQLLVAQLAEMIRLRNSIDSEIAALVGRPALVGHVGEFIASLVFAIELYPDATHAHSDGVFRAGPLAGRTVNVKWYLKRENALDLTADCNCDFHLVMTGPHSADMSSRGRSRPWVITHVYLFETQRLLQELRDRGVQVGVATSVREQQWLAAEIYPTARNPLLPLTEEQRAALALFEDTDRL